jgi:hypothetical protein
LGIEAAGAHECLGGFSVLGARRRAEGKKIMKEELRRQKSCGMRIAERKRAEDRGYLQARLMRSETELKLSQYKIQ